MRFRRTAGASARRVRRSSHFRASAVDAGHAVEQPGDRPPRRAAAAAAAAQRRRHPARVVAAVVGQHRDEARASAARWARMYCSRRGAVRGTISAALVERQHLAERVVAAHRDDARRRAPSGSPAACRRSCVDTLAASPRAPRIPPALGLHERPEHQQRRSAAGIVLVGARAPSRSGLAVAAAAGRDQQERAVGDLRSCAGTPRRRQLAPQIAGIDHPPPHARPAASMPASGSQICGRPYTQISS